MEENMTDWEAYDILKTAQRAAADRVVRLAEVPALVQDWGLIYEALDAYAITRGAARYVLGLRIKV
jgi:hypothetical protein